MKTRQCTKSGTLIILVLMLALLISIGFTSCQSSAPAPTVAAPAAASAASVPSAASGAPSSTTSAVATTAAQAAAPASGKIVIATTVDANSLDFMKMNTTNPEFTLAAHLFDALVYRDENMAIKPALAESWKNVDDKTWEFKLRKDVKFQNGEPFNAASVKFTFERAADPATKSTDQLLKFVSFDRVEVVDDYTVRIITKAPAPSMLTRLSLFYMYAPKYYGESTPEIASAKPVGTGPYKLVEWAKNDHITLEANADYWGAKPSIKTLVFRPIPEVGTRIAELKSGGVDVAPGIPPDQIKSVDTNSTRSVVLEGGRRVMFGFHITKGSPVEDKRVRQAINYAVDVDAITKNLLSGFGSRNFNLVTKKDISANIKPYTYDPAKAKQLLTEAGYPNGFDLILDSPAGRLVKDKEVAQAVADYLTKVGIKATVKTFDWSTYTGQVLIPRKSDPMFLLSFSSYFDAPIDLVSVLDYNNALNPTEYNSPDMQALLKELASTMDEAKRKDLVDKIEALAYDDCPWLYMYYQNDVYGVSKRLDWKPRVDEYMMFTNAKLVQ